MKKQITIVLTTIAMTIATIPVAAQECDPSVNWVILGANQLEQNDYSNAVNSLTCGLQTDPRAEAIYNQRGNAYRGLGQNDLAIADYNKSLELNPLSALVYNNRGWTYYLQGDLDKALEDFNKAIELNPQLAYAYNNRGLINHLKGNLDAASADYERAIELGHPVSWPEMNLAQLRFEQGKLDKGAFVTISNTTSSTTIANDLHKQAATAYSNGNFLKAASLYEEIVRNDPNDALAQFRLGFAAAESGDYQTSLNAYQRSIDLNYSDKVTAYINRGVVYSWQDHYSAALPELDKALEINPNYTEALHRRAVVNARLGNKEAAMSDMNHAFEIGPVDSDMHLSRGIMLVELGERAEAGNDFLAWLAGIENTRTAIPALSIGDSVDVIMDWGSVYEIPFTGITGTVLHFSATPASNNALPVDALLVVLGPDGKPVTSDDDSGPGFNPMIHEFTVPMTGEYTLIISHAGAGSMGNVTVSIMECH